MTSLILFPISVSMGPTEIPSQSTETIKIPTAHYEFGANFVDPKVRPDLIMIGVENRSMVLFDWLLL